MMGPRFSVVELTARWRSILLRCTLRFERYVVGALSLKELIVMN